MYFKREQLNDLKQVGYIPDSEEASNESTCKGKK